ncbi:hypothetical protein ACFL2P_03100 [Candidatus Moduliflexota bacterium]
MERIKGEFIKGCNYIVSMFFVSFVFIPALALAGESGSKDISGRKFCVILRPDLKPSPEAERILVGEPAGDIKPLKEFGKASFFEGSVQKLGFGAPDCFFINRQIKSNPVTGNEGLHAGPAERLEAMATEREGRDFFPTVGFFNRTSFGRGGGLAVGAGLAGSSLLEEEEGTKPEAKVSVMFGFGF